MGDGVFAGANIPTQKLYSESGNPASTVVGTLGRAAARWDPYGAVTVTPGLGRSDLTIDTVRRYRLDPLANPRPEGRTAGRLAPEFRVAARGSAPSDAERVVERVRDGWGREWAVVLARAPSP